MAVNQKPTGRAATIPAGLAYGILVSMCIFILGIMIAAKLIEQEIVQWNQTGYMILVILPLSSWAGAMVAAHRIKRQRLMTCMMNGGLFFFILLIMTALFFGGQYSGVGEIGLIILCGSALAFLSGNHKKRRKPGKVRMRNC